MEPQKVSTRQTKLNYESLRSKFKLEGLVHHLQFASESKPTHSVCESESTITSMQDCTAWGNNQFEADYDIGEVVGQGANALVRKCVRRIDGQVFAVKVSQVE